MAKSFALTHTHTNRTLYLWSEDPKGFPGPARMAETFKIWSYRNETNKERFQVSVLKSRILIADPDPDVSHTLQLYFQANGHEAQIIEKACEIVKTARQWQPNAILISAELTDKNPYQVCQEVLEDTLTAHIPLIMLLHLDDRQARLAALETGVDDIVVKPIDIEELRLRIEAAIRLSTMRVEP